MNIIKLILAGSALAFGLVAPGNASVVRFSYTGDKTASWTMPSSPIPSGYYPDTFYFFDVPITINGTIANRNLQFYDASGTGGLDIFTDGDFNSTISSSSTQFFSGTVDAPTFTLGTYHLSALNPFASGNGTLVISQIPEPSSWAMLTIGFGIVGVGVRRRGRVSVAA